MKLSSIFGTACALALFTTVSAHAVTLASYPFTGSSLASTDGNVNSTASSIVLDTGLTSTGNRFLTPAGNPALRINGDETGTSFPLSNLANDDFTLEITPASGQRLELSTLTFDALVSAATVDAGIRIQLSNNGTAFTNLGTITGLASTTFAAQNFDLSPANTALATGLPIYVRFLIMDSVNAASACTAFDNIVVSGTVSAAVPEPGMNALLALGALGLIGGGVRRRRRATV